MAVIRQLFEPRFRTEAVAIGASAGGVAALSSVVSKLPEDFPASIFVVMHFPESQVSVLPQILSRRTPMKVIHAEDDMPTERSTIYVAPPGCHLLVKIGHLKVVVGPKENGSRPAIDPLFRTAARTYGPAVAAVVMTGLLYDGSLGLAAVEKYGGVTIVQDPDDAMFGDMPRNALQQARVDFVLPADEIAELLITLAGSGEAATREVRPETRDPVEMSQEELRMLTSGAEPSVFTCPDCNGTLFKVQQEGGGYYRCRVGHSFSVESLENEQSSALEDALWSAIRALEENISLLRKLEDTSVHQGLEFSARNYADKRTVQEERVDTIRALLKRLGAA